MAETEENNAPTNAADWRALISSPRGITTTTGLFSGFLPDGFQDDFSPRKGEEGGGFSGLEAMMEGSSNWKPPQGRNGGSIAERRAARCGFNAMRLNTNTARFRTTSPLSSPSVRSPYLTIPPGLSPTSLLDSPVMLTNSQAQPSPTTGTFRFPSQCLEAISLSAVSSANKENDAAVDSSFIFKPHGDPTSFPCISSTENQLYREYGSKEMKDTLEEASSTSSQTQNVEMGDASHQNIVPVQTQLNFECQEGSLRQTAAKSNPSGSPSIVEGATSMIVDSNCIPLQTSDSAHASKQAPQIEEPVHVEDTGTQRSEGDQRGEYPPTVTGRPSEDGYNWRKYGQKQVKGSEYPRSYYKCTHQNCQVKKKIERSHDGQITEIIYKGGHNHPKPQPNRQSAVGSAFSVNGMLETGEEAGSYVKVERGSAWRSISQGPSDWRTDGQERTASTSVVTDVSDPLSTAQGNHLVVLESAGTPEFSFTHASHDEDEDRATQGSVSLGDDGDDDEFESKRRKKDSCIIETSMASRAVREPRVVVQTDSEVDILVDGYRWRKYGQKVVKGNPNPRSYYKCTSAGCSVRKHVERASHDLKYVITTYEGKHNHEVPAARNSSHMNLNGGNASSCTSNTQTSLTPLRSTNNPKPEMQVQDMVPRFERKPEFSNEFFRPTNYGGFATDMKFGPAAGYDMKLPPFQTSMPYGTYGLNTTHNGTHQAAHIAQVVPNFPLSMPTNVPLSANLSLSGLGSNNPGNSVGPQSYMNIQQTKDADIRLLRPKQEHKDDAVFDGHMSINPLPNASASMYSQMMGGYPM